MHTNFYSFDIDYEHQLNTNWCWSACFSWISKSLKLNTEFKEQFQFQAYYNNCILNETKIADTKLNLVVDTTSDHVDRLINDTLNLDYELIDLIQNQNEGSHILNKVFSFQNVAYKLRTHNAPWIISTEYHMLLISGFGSDGFRNYVLVSDPNIIENEKYLPIDTFLEKYGNGIRKIWQLKHKSSDAAITELGSLNFSKQNSSLETYILKSELKRLQQSTNLT